MPSAKCQTEDENFQRLARQNKYLQRRMNVKKMISMSKFFAGGGEMMEWKTALMFYIQNESQINLPSVISLPW